MSNKAEKRGLMPMLRFPEFREAVEWEEVTIGDIGSFYYGKSAPKWSLVEDAPTRCVRYGELYTKFGAIITETYSRTNIDPNNLKFSKGGEILVPRVGEKPEDFGKCCCYLPLSNIAIGEMISVFETKQNPLFYTYYFRHLYRQFAKVVEGQNVKNLYYVELEPLPICRPPLPEQQKIADCLASLDELITLEAQQLDTLKTHKKGLMQQLFPAEGETLPKLRFPEFRDAGEWENKKLSSLIQLISGLHLSPDQYSNSGTTPYFTGPSDFTNEIQNVSKWTEESTSIARENDILITVKGSGVGEIFFLALQSVAMGRQLMAIRSKKGSSRFIYQFLLTKRTRFGDLASGNLIPGLSRGDILDLEAHFPSLPEQQKIADCLASLDNLITAQIQKLAALKTHKKGLMQQLFPAPDEVSA